MVPAVTVTVLKEGRHAKTEAGTLTTPCYSSGAISSCSYGHFTTGARVREQAHDPRELRMGRSRMHRGAVCEWHTDSGVLWNKPT